MNIKIYVYKKNNFFAHYMHQTSHKLLEMIYMNTNNIYRIFLQINIALLLFIADSYFAVRNYTHKNAQNYKFMTTTRKVMFQKPLQMSQ
jgi:hypothetical protein